MTTIPASADKKSQCSECNLNCLQLCKKCGMGFCTKHLLVHFERCVNYMTVIQTILRDELTTGKEICGGSLRSR